ncbi:MAG TPA: molybdenum cofactor biosynthesis protein MoaE [Solirubrobacteraceae bacterium]
MTVRVHLFAILRERAGSNWVEVDLAEGATVADAIRVLSELPALAGVLDRIPVQMAVNREYATIDTRLLANDELALIPPISGGVDIHVRVTEEPLSLDALTRGVTRPGAGAIVVFQGMPRDVSRLDYEAYREMAEQRMTTILNDCLQRHQLHAVAAEHRVGPVELSEPSVIVAVSAAHRSEAFAAATEAIDRIKAEAPIWKQEVDHDGTVRRVAGAPPQAGAPEPVSRETTP